MAVNEDVLENMDKAAELADEELKEISKDSVILVADWWKKHYLKILMKQNIITKKLLLLMLHI